MSKEKLNIIYTLLGELLEGDINIEELNWNEIEIIKKMSELEFILRFNKCEKIEPADIINLNDYVAWKLWSRDDIEKAIKAEGYEATEKNINVVCNHSVLDQLGDCTDEEWDILRCAARESLRSDQLKEIKSYEDIDNVDELVSFVYRANSTIDKEKLDIVALVYNVSPSDVSQITVIDSFFNKDKMREVLERVESELQKHLVDEINNVLQEHYKLNYPIAI